MIHAFIGGLHRSGTSLVHDTLARHADVAAFGGTGVQQDEGQFLQSVYPNVNQLGGAGVFAFHPDSHLTETSPLLERALELRRDWERHWGASRRVRVEKTPQNLVMSRFLAAAFPSSHFVFVLRHPLVVALATQKWSHTSVTSLVAHWLRAHRLLAGDLASLERVMLIRYESFVAHPEEHVAALADFLGIEGLAAPGSIDRRASEPYAEAVTEALRLRSIRGRGQVLDTNLLPRGYRARLRFERTVERGIVRSRLGFGADARINLLHREVAGLRPLFEAHIAKFGYSFDDLERPNALVDGAPGFDRLVVDP